MTTHTTVCVDDDLAASQASVGVWSTKNELAGWVDVDRRIVALECFRDCRQDDLLDEVRTNLSLTVHTIAVLS